MSESSEKNSNVETANLPSTTTPTTPVESQQSVPLPSANSSATTPTSSVTGVPASRLKAPTHFGGSSSSVSKIGRLCSHATPKAGPPPRDHGSILTHDTEQFIIGQRVWVGGIRPGQIAYIGDTHFAPGEWAGVVLDEPNGKNDGCVAGKRYFQCEPKRGIFSRLTRLTLAPLPGAQTPTSPLARNSPDRSRTVSPTASIRSSFLRSPGKTGLTVGDRVIVSSGFGSRPGILRYLGETQFASGNWCGVELDEDSGKNDGSVDGIRYFECKPKYGVFVPIAKVSLSPSSKKSRLTRTGSRESLTSIGTMNSIATTNTSRLRLNAQRKSSSIKPVAVTTPKSQFSMQDLLREKQQHIEQLMIERDLDREDSQNTSLQFQKTINELKVRIALLERQLSEERKKAEDLQFSIDEATFCGDELNAQTQVYKEKIHELESKIKDLASGRISSEEASSAANTEIDELKTTLKQQTEQFHKQLAEDQEELQRLQANIKYLKDENETLQKELVAKDESLEKFSLSESGIENMRKELVLVQEEHQKEREEMLATFNKRLEEKSEEIKRLLAEKGTILQSLAIAEGERSTFEDECRTVREEYKTQVNDINSRLAELTAKLSMKQAECATLDELVKSQQLSKAEEKTLLEEKINEISRLKTDIATLQDNNRTLETKLQNTQEEVQKLSKLKSDTDTKLNEALNEDRMKSETIAALEIAIAEVRSECANVRSENQQLNENIKKLQSDLETERNSGETERRSLKDKEIYIEECNRNLKQAQESIEQLQYQLEEALKSQQMVVEEKTKEIQLLREEIQKMHEKTTALEGESTVTITQLSAKISQLESQNKRLEADLKNSSNMIEEQRRKSTQQDAVIEAKQTELKLQTEALENTTTLLEKLKKEQESALDKKQILEEELKKSEEKIAQQQLNLGDLTRKLESTNTKCDNLFAQNKDLQQEIIAVRTSNSTVNNEAKKLNEELEKKQNEILNLISSNDKTRIEMTGQMEELQQKLTNSIKDVNDLKEVVQKSKDELSLKMQHITNLEERTIKQELVISDNQRQRENLQAKCDALMKQNESLQQDLTTLRTSSTDSNAELLKLSQEITNKQKAFEDLMDKSSTERASLESQLQASQQRIDAMCSQVETLTKEMKTVTEESFNRFELLKQEQEKCGKQELEMADLQRKLDSLLIMNESLEEKNKTLQNDLNILRQSSSGSNDEIVKLTDELSKKQQLLQQLTDKSNEERLGHESQLQGLKQSMQAQQSELENLRHELKAAENAKIDQLAEFEDKKQQLVAKAQAELEELKQAETKKQQTVIESFEAQIKNSDQSKAALDEAISSLQKQIQLLQDELLKSQLDFKAKEGEMQKQIETYRLEKEQIITTLHSTQNEGSMALTNLQQENMMLRQSIEKLTQELKEKESSFVKLNCEAEQQLILQSNIKSEYELQLQKLQNALELSNSDCEHKTKLLEEDKSKIDGLKAMLEAIKNSNEQISATNAALAKTLEILEQEKCETANIFELFEMESDQNMEKLIEKLSTLKQELANAQEQLRTKDAQVAEYQQKLMATDSTVNNTQISLNDAQNTILELRTKLKQLEEANQKLQNTQIECQEKLKNQADFELQLEEYKKIIDEMDETSSAKSVQLEQLQCQITELQKEKSKSTEIEQALKDECASLQRKLDLAEIDKTKEIVALKQRINDLQSISKLKQNGVPLNNPNSEVVSTDDSTAQINFLNSIIADMQKKNDTLKAKIEALEALPTDYTKPAAFELIAKRKPAPRLFCDICDEFDKHETEDCPLQECDDRDSPIPRAERNNNDSANRKERKLPEPRKYCESCEVFGHETGECVDECY